jgi:CheY-like chemotaxis protein
MTDSPKDIWFIDDDELFRVVVENFVSESAYSDRVQLFEDGDEALMELMQRRGSTALPKLIFLDLNMTNLGGWQMLDLLNQIREFSAKVIIVSSSMRKEDVNRAKEERLVVDYVVKPMSKGDFERLAKSWIN